jgi:hypothetical protein
LCISNVAHGRIGKHILGALPTAPTAKSATKSAGTLDANADTTRPIGIEKVGCGGLTRVLTFVHSRASHRIPCYPIARQISRLSVSPKDLN